MEIFSKLPYDLQECIYRYKRNEVNGIVSMVIEQIQKKWWKYCNCVNCTARRGRFQHFVDGYVEDFSV